MPRKIFNSALVLSIFVSLLNTEATSQTSGTNGNLNEHLKPLEPFIGKTWKGTAPEPDPEKPFVDISKWERALNGQAVRILHSVNDGEYGGETIITWNVKKEAIEFYYFTTAGFMTHGTMSFSNGRIESREQVTGNKDGITEVKSVGSLLPDGRLHNKAYYLKNDKWEEGHEFFYVEAPDEVVRFH